MIEAGVPGYEAANWFGTAVPAKTPPAIVAKLSQEIGRVLRLPDVRERLLTQGMEPVSNTPDVFCKIHSVRDRQVGGGRESFWREAGVK